MRRVPAPGAPPVELKRAHGQTLEALAEEFGLSRQAIWRHWRDHVTDEAKAGYLAGALKLEELKERAEAEQMSLLDYFGVMRSILTAQFCAAAEAGAHGSTALLAGRLLECLKQIAALTGEVQRVASSVTNVQNNFFGSPDFAALSAGLISALAPHPAARDAVIQLLHKLETDATRSAPKMIEGTAE